MNILVVGDNTNLADCHQKFGSTHDYAQASDHEEIAKVSPAAEIIFDFVAEHDPSHLRAYHHPGPTLFVSSVKRSLRQLTQDLPARLERRIFGFNGLPGFLPLPLMEVSLWNRADGSYLKDVASRLATDIRIVADRPGMITARIICMIINEAYFAVEDGTATEQDIDLAMKLGTSYPYGPFEWARKIGIAHVYEVLDGTYRETGDERYSICPLLREEYLSQTK